jgi:hypothetical protein
MATTARGPRIYRGALASIEPTSRTPRIIPFQYNPATLKRSLKPMLAGGESGDRSQAVRIVNAPNEQISVEIEIDAADALEVGDETAKRHGIHPQLAALELLVFPTSSKVISNQRQIAEGVIEIAPMLAPRVLFIWGQGRVVPVQLSSYSISEEEFDATLNPIRATVGLEMRVLSYSDLSASNPDFDQYLAYQQSREAIYGSAVTSDFSAVGGVSVESEIKR